MAKLVKTYIAKTDLSAKEGYAVFLTTDDKINNTPVARIATANVRAIGVIENPPSGTGKAMSVALSGLTRGIAGGDITAGLALKTDANGALVHADTDKDKVVAIAQEAAASGELFDIEIVKYDIAV